MNWNRQILIALVMSACVCGQVPAQEKSKTKKAGKTKPAAPAAPAATPAANPTAKLEVFVMLPEPKVMRTDRSRFLPDAKTTVISPAHETTESPGVKAYTEEEFAKIGISVETFMERARAAADRRLAGLRPDFVKDDAGQIRYAVYRGDSPLLASLLMAPSLGTTFQKIFGTDVWALLPDRNSLFIFPAKPDSLEEFTADLRDRYDTNPYAASAEIFLLKPDGGLPRVVGTFGG